MAKIIADTPEIKEVLTDLDKAIERHGGTIHPNVMLIARGRELSIEADNVKQGEVILHVPAHALVPSEEMDIRVQDDRFHIKIPEGSTLNEAQKELGQLMFKLYNLTDKARLHRETSPWLNLKDYPEIAFHLFKGRTLLGKNKAIVDTFNNKFEGFDVDRYVCADFLKSRVLAFKSQEFGINTDSKMIMPVVDFLNHHSLGAFYQSGEDNTNGDLRVVCSQPKENSKECFAFYRPMDPIDSFMNYGFADQSAYVTRSVPFDIRVPKLGRISIKSRGDMINKNKLAKPLQDLRFFMPVMRKAYDILSVSHIYIPGPQAPLSMRRILNVFLLHLNNRKPLEQERLESFIKEAETQIISQNKVFYNTLETLVDKAIQKDEKNFSLQQLKIATDLQLDRINAYKTLKQTKAA